MVESFFCQAKQVARRIQKGFDEWGIKTGLGRIAARLFFLAVSGEKTPDTAKITIIIILD